MNNIVVEAKDLSVIKDNKPLISSCTFSVYKNEILIILGPNGAGKSTLLKALLGLIPYQGSVNWHTQKVNYLPPQETFNREHMPPMTVLEFFSFKHTHPQDVTTALAEIGLDASYAHRSLLHLSTGEFQRMLLAWSLVDNPDVLLLDEPSAGMDIKAEEMMYTLLHKRWHERGITIILVTHNLSVVWKHAHRVMCLNKTIVGIGKPQDVLTPHTLAQIYGEGAWIYEHLHHPHHR